MLESSPVLIRLAPSRFRPAAASGHCRFVAFQGLEEENVSLEIALMDRIVRSDDAAELQVICHIRLPTPLSGVDRALQPRGFAPLDFLSIFQSSAPGDRPLFTLNKRYFDAGDWQISRVIEGSVAKLEGVEGVKHWLGIIGESSPAFPARTPSPWSWVRRIHERRELTDAARGEELEWIDLGSLRGFRQIQMVQVRSPRRFIGVSVLHCRVLPVYSARSQVRHEMYRALLMAPFGFYFSNRGSS
jgi:hypothetical protein